MYKRVKWVCSLCGHTISVAYVAFPTASCGQCYRIPPSDTDEVWSWQGEWLPVVDGELTMVKEVKE